MRLRTTFILVLATVLCCTCADKRREILPPDRPDVPESPEVGADVIFSESFNACVYPDGPYIQSDNFRNDVENPLSHVDFKSSEWKTVATSHVCPDEYMRSRGFSDWVYLFRVKERVGYISCGENTEGKRGIIQSPMLSKIDGVEDVRVSFRLKPMTGLTDSVCFKVVLAGVIRSATLNGRPMKLRHPHEGIEHALTIAPNEMLASWNEVIVEVEKATDGTMLYWAGASNDKNLCHGFSLDDVKVVRTATMTRAPKNLRVLFWNIQNGMWSDQQNGFANFLAFVKKYDPDVCVWCEAQSIYEDRSTTMMPAAKRVFPDGWKEFAAQYGHDHVALGGYRLYADDYYPQIISSKYPISTLALITETDAVHQELVQGYADGKSHAAEYHATCTPDYCPVAHGAAVHSLDVDGAKVNFVTLHLWPHAYSYYAKYVSKQTSDPESVGGNAQRLAEIKYICDRSINDPTLSKDENWLMMGDFNTRSRADNWFYGIDGSSALLSSHDYILNSTPYKDVIGECYPGHFFATRTWANDAGGKDPPRYDFVYASPSMMGKVRNALILNESWTNMVWAMSNYYDSSDHRPILIDFDLEK